MVRYEDADTARVIEDFGLDPSTALVDLANDFVRVRDELRRLRVRDEKAQTVVREWHLVQPRPFVMPAEITALAVALDALAAVHEGGGTDR